MEATAAATTAGATAAMMEATAAATTAGTTAAMMEPTAAATAALTTTNTTKLKNFNLFEVFVCQVNKLSELFRKLFLRCLTVTIIRIHEPFPFLLMKNVELSAFHNQKIVKKVTCAFPSLG